MSNYVEVRKVTSGKKKDLGRLPNLKDCRDSSRKVDESDVLVDLPGTK